MNKVTAVTGINSGLGNELIAALQDQMARYTHLANTLNAKAQADYRALQAALQSGDLSNAEAALTRLSSDSADQAAQQANTAATPPPSSSSQFGNLDVKA